LRQSQRVAKANGATEETKHLKLKTSNMKRILIFIVALFTSFSMAAQQKTISYIKNDGAWYKVYDEQGKQITTMSKSAVGEVVGWGADFFVTLDGAWYKVYDQNGKKITTLSKQSVGTVISVSSTTFTSRDGAWLKIYDKHGKKIATNSAM